MTTTLAIDPGKAIGLTWGRYSTTEAWVPTRHAIMDWEEFSYSLHAYPGEEIYANKLIIERFVPQSGTDYTLSEDDLAAVEVIGVLKHAVIPSHNEVYWQARGDKWDVPDDLLKQHGLWVTGAQVGHTDGRDANDATIHTLHWLKNTIRHVPSLLKYWS